MLRFNLSCLVLFIYSVYWDCSAHAKVDDPFETISIGTIATDFPFHLSEDPYVIDRGIVAFKGKSATRAIGTTFCLKNRSGDFVGANQKIKLGLTRAANPHFTHTLNTNEYGCISTTAEEPLLFSYEHFSIRKPQTLNFWISTEENITARFPVMINPWEDNHNFFVNSQVGGRVDYSDEFPLLLMEDVEYRISATAKKIQVNDSLQRVEFERVRFVFEPLVMWPNSKTLGERNFKEEPLPPHSPMKIKGVFAGISALGDDDVDFELEGDAFKIINTFQVTTSVDEQGLIYVDLPLAYLWQEIPYLEDEMALFIQLEAVGLRSTVLRAHFDFLASRAGEEQSMIVKSPKGKSIYTLANTIFSLSHQFSEITDKQFLETFLPDQEVIKIQKRLPQQNSDFLKNWKMSVQNGSGFSLAIPATTLKRYFSLLENQQYGALSKEDVVELCQRIASQISQRRTKRKLEKECKNSPSRFFQIEYFEFINKLDANPYYVGEGIMDQIEVISSYFHEEGMRNSQGLGNRRIKGWAWDAAGQESKFSFGAKFAGSGFETSSASKYIPVYFKGESVINNSNNYLQGERFRTKIETNTKVEIERSTFILSGYFDQCLKISWNSELDDEKGFIQKELHCRQKRSSDKILHWYYISDNRHSAIEPDRFKRNQRAFTSMIRGEYQYKKFLAAVKDNSATFLALRGEDLSTEGLFSENSIPSMDPGGIPGLIAHSKIRLPSNDERAVLCQKNFHDKTIPNESPRLKKPWWNRLFPAEWDRTSKDEFIPNPFSEPCH